MNDKQPLIESHAAKPITLSGRGAVTETRALAGALNLINSPDFSSDEGDGPFRPPSDPIPGTASAPEATRRVTRPKAPPVPLTPPAPPVREDMSVPARVFTTGRLMSGKDHVLASIGYNILGLADPLYKLQDYFFPDTDKITPGARAFLQTVGQWGRGQIDNDYPLTPARAIFVAMVRSFGSQGLLDKSVDWDLYGRDEDIWLKALMTRVKNQGDTFPANAVSNVRFANESKFLAEAGWTSFHVMCSPRTWERRLKLKGLTPAHPSVNDTSEKMAIELDAQVLKTYTSKPQGPKLRVIWNDEEVRCPSPRLIDFKNTNFSLALPTTPGYAE